MAKRNATSFVVDKMEFPGKAGAIKPVHKGENLVGIEHACPCGCGNWSWLRLDNSECPTFQKWDLKSGDLLHLTLDPSIGIRPKDPKTGAYHWHGYLKNGIFEEC